MEALEVQYAYQEVLTVAGHVRERRLNYLQHVREEEEENRRYGRPSNSQEEYSRNTARKHYGFLY